MATDEAAAAAVAPAQQRPPLPMRPPGPAWRPAIGDEGERLDRLSNSTVDLIHAGKLDEADRMAQRLLDEFPDLPDGHMRLGQLLRARGEPVRAAQHLRLAAAVARAANDDPALPLSLEAEADSIDPPSP